MLLQKRFKQMLGIAGVLCVSLPISALAQSWANPEKVAAVSRGEIEEANVSWWGFDKEDSTQYVQAALDSGAKRVVVPAMNSTWIVEPLFVNVDNLEIFFEPSVILQAKKGKFLGRNDSLLSIIERKNITLIGYGAQFRMHKEDYWEKPYRRAEWRNTLNIRGAEGIHIEGLTFSNSGGDGIYLGATKNMPYVKNVVIRAVHSDSNNRQGLSVISADNLLVEKSVFSNTIGTAPMAGIDLEPNNPAQFLRDVVIRNNIFLNNSQLGMHMWLSNLTSESEPVSITIENNTIIGGEIGIHVAFFRDNGPGGFVKIQNNIVKDSRYAGILVRRVSASSNIDLSFADNVLFNTAHMGRHSDEVIEIYTKVLEADPATWWGSNAAPILLTAQRDVPQYQGGFTFSGDTVFQTSGYPVIRVVGTRNQQWVERFGADYAGDETEGFRGWKDVSGEIFVTGPGSRRVDVTSPVVDFDVKVISLPEN